MNDTLLLCSGVSVLAIVVIIAMVLYDTRKGRK